MGFSTHAMLGGGHCHGAYQRVPYLMVFSCQGIFRSGCWIASSAIDEGISRQAMRATHHYRTLWRQIGMQANEDHQLCVSLWRMLMGDGRAVEHSIWYSTSDIRHPASNILRLEQLERYPV